MSQQVPLSPLKQAFLALQQAQGRIANLEAELEARRAEPVALIGVGCRIPGAIDGPEGYWALLRDAKGAVSEQTMQRWSDFGVAPRLGTEDAAARWGALLDAPDRFDPQFFGISPREAANMDPQQRLLLEVSWEALEDAAIAPGSTYGSRTGVYFGISANDFAQIELADSDETTINPHLASGGAHSVAAGRISYTFGWHGPAISIDTACSSSLVAVHLACEAIRSGDCDMALAGGVNLILSPTSSVAFARSGMLSSSGRVDAFGSGANGFVRGEGCGVVVLKRLSDARRDGDRVLAVILGSAVNHDGPGSGLTVPNGQAQAALLRAAHANAGISASAVGYVEAHGTGTRLGDPIEAEALGAVFGAGAGAAGTGAAGASAGGRERPLAMGSVKTNLGHLESAAGIAGLIKVLLALEHGELPAQLHGDPPSEHVRWSDLPLEVVRERRRWEPIGGRRIAGVSAFGFSGTNAHVIVEEAPAEEIRTQASRPQESVEVLALSAKSAASLQMLAERYAELLEAHPELDWSDACYTAAVGRTHFKHRLAVVASSVSEAAMLLRGVANFKPGTVLCGNAGQELEAKDQVSAKTGSEKAALDLAEAYASGAESDWSAWRGDHPGRRIRLPGYAFERERHWITGSRRKSQSGCGDATGHPLLGERLRLAGEGARYEWRARPMGELAWLGEHRIGGRAILPATAYLEMLLAAAERLPGSGPVKVELLHLIASLPVVEEDGLDRVVQVVVEPVAGDAYVQGEASRNQVRVYSLNEQATGSLNEPATGSREAHAVGEWRLHGEGHVSRAETPSAHNAKPLTTYEMDLEAVRERCPEVVKASAFYARMEVRGAKFGPRFQRVERVWRGNGEALGEVAVDSTTEPYGNRLHPACLDACLQVAAALLPDAGGDTASEWLPARIEGFQYHSALPQPHETVCLVHATLLSRSTKGRGQVQIAIYVHNQTRPFATLEKLTFERGEKSEPRNTTADWIYALTWEKSPLTNAAEMASTEWVIASSGTPPERGLGNAVADALRSKGQQVAFRDLSTPHSKPTAELQLKPGSKAGILYLHETLVGDSDSAEDFTLRARPAVEGLLDLCRSVRQRGSALSRLYVLTCNAHAVSHNDRTIYPLEAVVSGLAATVSAEYESLRCVRIDLDVTDVPGAAPLVADEMLSDFSDDRSSDDWIAFRGEERYLPRLERVPARKDDRPLQIAWTPGQGINSLTQKRLERRSLKPGEVEIEVRAAGLNFHDVLSVLGVLRDTNPLGSECSGVVSRIGPDVRHSIGDEVVAMAAGALATAVITPQDLVFQKPDTLSFEQAASIPIAYLTAAYCLMEKGALADGKAAGKRVLIHAATGGVGLAAVNLCKRYGAEIFATAGSESKRAYLRSLGVTHVMDSRSAAFAEEIERITHGHGVDIVLNCLAGALTDAGLSAAASPGDFIDIGATDLRDPDKIAVQYPGVRYHAIDLAAALRLDSDGMQRRLGDLIQDIGGGVLPPLPVERFAFTDAAPAFRHMAAARHIGKIALVDSAPEAASAMKIVRDGSYIVTGGMTGLGFEVARWLAARGAGRIVVGGRRDPTPETAAEFKQLRASGTEVIVVKGAIADLHGVARMVEAAGDSLRGVLHCAGAVQDAPLAKQTWQTFSEALRAKADGAWLLHEQTQSRALDFFVLFSSWASIAGSPGAANYCAANAFLDALAQHRHAIGLPATSINWGPWAQAGMAAGRPEESFGSKGLTPMLPETAIAALELAILDSRAQVAIADVDWTRVGKFLHYRRNIPTVYQRMIGNGDQTAENSRRKQSISKARQSGATPGLNDARDVSQHVRRLALEVLDLPLQTVIDPTQPLQELGLDSILAVELAASISSLMGRPAPSGLLFDYPTVASLTGYVTEHVTEARVAVSANGLDKSKGGETSFIDRLEELTDEEVERLLRDKTFAN